MKKTGQQTVVCYASCVGEVQNMRVVHFLRALAEAGFLTIAIRPGTLTDASDVSIITHIPLPTPSSSFWYGAGFLNTLQAMGQRIGNSIVLSYWLLRVRPDIILCTEPDSWLVAVIMKFWLRCKVIADLREVYDDRALAFPGFSQKLVRMLLRSSMRALSRVTDEIIHVSKERQQVYSYLHKPGVVIGSYPELSLFPLQCINRDRVSTGETPKQMIAIHSGALRSTYASDQLLEALILAAQSFPSLKFIVLGGIAGALKKGDLLETLKTSGILEFYEKVPFSEVVQKLQKSDIGINLVLPIDTAHLLAQPQKLYEYLAAGLPVVAADVPTIHRVLTEYNCGLLVDPHSPNEIAAAIVRLAEDANLREQMGLNARQAAEREFNWESQASRLCLVVESLLDKTTL